MHLVPDVYNPPTNLKAIDNYMYRLLEYSVTMHFVVIVLKDFQCKHGLFPERELAS
jgi:hypothetical protein